MKIYGDSCSGNCYKVQLVCALLNIDYQWMDINILKGDTKNQDFLNKNPNGKIPLLELAKVQQWQFFEQYSHEPYIAVARFIAKYLDLPEDRRADYESKQEGGYKALTIMEQQLQQTSFLIGEQFTTADISLYAYTNVADEGGFDLTKFPNIERWLKRISSQTNYIAIDV
jgi:glutathione S-transferase